MKKVPVYCVGFALLGALMMVSAGTGLATIREGVGTESCPFVTSNGAVVMEAEHYTTNEASAESGDAEWVMSTRFMGAVNDQYMVIHHDVDPPMADDWSSGAELSYAIQFATSGTYHVWVRREATDGKEDSVFFGLDGLQSQGQDDTGDFGEWRWKAIGVVNIETPGDHNFQLRRHEAGYRVDRILLTLDRTMAPEGNGPPESRRMEGQCDVDSPFFEAETAIFSGVLEHRHPGFCGTGYVNLTNESESFIRWTVPTAERRTYVLAFRHANGSAADRRMDIYVNDDLTVEALSFPPTGAWTNWESQTTTAMLDAGDHVIEAISLTADGGPNMDFLEVAPVIEAEDAGGLDGDIENRHTGFTGAGYANFHNRVGSSAQWTIHAPQAGHYEVAFRYANGSRVDRRMVINVNDQAAMEASFRPTEGWDDWKLAHLTVNLEAGDNTLGVTSLLSQGGPNLDHMQVYTSSP